MEMFYKLTAFSFVVIICIIYSPIISSSQSLQTPLAQNVTDFKLDKETILGGYTGTTIVPFNALPQVSVGEPNNVYVLWHDRKEYPGTIFNETGVLLAVSNNSGSSFNIPINVRNQTELVSRYLINSTDLSVVSDMRLASDNDGNVYVVWGEWPSTDLDFDIFMRKSADGGSRFDSVTNLSNDTSDGYLPAIEAENNNTFYVTWQGRKDVGGYFVFFKRSIDGGNTFERRIDLSNQTSAEVQAQLAVSGKKVYLAWDYGNSIFLATSENAGSSFSQLQEFKVVRGIPEWDMGLAANGNDVYLTWGDGFDIFFAKSTNGGMTFGNVTEITDRSQCFYSTNQPDVTVRNDEVFVVWRGNICDTFGADLFLKHSADGGKSFGNMTNLTNNTLVSRGNYLATSVDSSNPEIIASQNQIYIVWENKYGQYGDIMFSRVK
jgi:hypothetical protein